GFRVRIAVGFAFLSGGDGRPSGWMRRPRRDSPLKGVNRMSSIEMIVASMVGIGARRWRSSSLRSHSRRTPVCESLEGRELLNASWGMGGIAGRWDAAGGLPVGGRSAHFDHVIVFRGFDRQGPRVLGEWAQGKQGFGPFAFSAQAKADMQSLQTDVKQLQ